MANFRISDLTAVSAYADTQEFEVNDSGTSKKITGTQLKAGVLDSPSITGGLDVTGTVTADGLTVADGTSGQINVHSSSYNIQGGTNYGDLRINAPRFRFFEDGTTLRMNIDNGDISFYEDTGTTPKFFWDASAERLGIGTSSPSAIIHVTNSGGISESLASFEAASTKNGYVYINADDNRRKSLVFQSGGVDKFSMGVGDSDELSASSFYIGSGKSGGNTADLVIDSSGNVGIGTSSPSAALDVQTSDTFVSEFTSTSASNWGELRLRSAGGVGTNTRGRIIGGYDAGGSGYGGYLAFNTTSTSNANTERLRIDSSGNFLAGCTSQPNASNFGGSINPIGQFRCSRNSTGAATQFSFNNPNGEVGTIVTSGTATAYNTSSDQRLKENIVDAPSASDDIEAIQVRSFDWKADGSHQKYGMIAQELQTVAPEAVSAPENPEEMMGVDYSKLVPMLIKEVQQLRARVAQLEGAN